MATDGNAHDDLTRIKGIGKKREAWLQEKMGVYRFADLAARRADELETRLREAGQMVSRNAVQSWIDQATELMTLAQPDEEAVTNPVLDNEDTPNPLPEKIQEWHPFASFIVEYQERVQKGHKQLRTTVHHIEADREETWPDVVPEPLGEWMQEQAGVRSMKMTEIIDKTVSEEIITPELERSARVEDIQDPIKIKQLLVYQPPQSDVPVAIGEPERPFMGNVQADRPCTLAVLLEMPGQNSIRSGEINAQLYACNLTAHTKVQVPIKSEGRSAPGNDPSPKIEFASTSLLSGVYRFEIIVRKNKPLSQISYLELPILHVLE